MEIERIQVGFRYRKDLGDVRSLAQSIEEVGLLHPVVVTPEGRLIAGQRRLEACRALGWIDIPVTVVDLYQAARGEATRTLSAKTCSQAKSLHSSEQLNLWNVAMPASGKGTARTSVIPPQWRKVRGPTREMHAIILSDTSVSVAQPSSAPKQLLKPPRSSPKNTAI